MNDTIPQAGGQDGTQREKDGLMELLKRLNACLASYREALNSNPSTAKNVFFFK
jgi:hypothetical protein